MTDSRRGIVAVLLPLLLGACAAPPPEGSYTPPVPKEVRIRGLENARTVGDDLLFGAQASRDALRTLADRGYRTVVTTRAEGELDWDEKTVVEDLGLTFARLPMAKPVMSVPDEWVDRFDALMNEAERPLVVHCSSGNRVAGLWAIWLVERRGVPPDRALELGARAGMTRMRPVVEKRLGVERAPANE